MDGLRIDQLQTIPDERGIVRKIISAPELFLPIRDVYYTSIYRDIVKGWHGYKTKTICFTCISGCVKFVLWDGRTKHSTYGQTESFIIGTDAYYRIIVPPGVYSAFKGISDFSEIIVVADEVFTEVGMLRKPIEEIEYDWRTRNG